MTWNDVLLSLLTKMLCLLRKRIFHSFLRLFILLSLGLFPRVVLFVFEILF